MPASSFINEHTAEYFLVPRICKAFKEYNVPVFAGVPLASSVMELSFDTPCSWLYLNPEQIPDNDLICSIATEGQISNNEIESYVNLIDEHKMVELTMSISASQKVG